MVRFTKVSLVAGFAALASCTQSTPAASDSGAVAAAAAAPDAAADEQAIRAINPLWFKAHQAGDVEGLVALYADDAVISAPGAPAARGKDAIRAAFTKEIAGMKAAGLSQTSGTNGEFAVSGDLGYEWNTYTVKDASGKTVDEGKYTSIFARRNGKWMIIKDTWNSDRFGAPA